jgi:hypothetical protein
MQACVTATTTSKNPVAASLSRSHSSHAFHLSVTLCFREKFIPSYGECQSSKRAETRFPKSGAYDSQSRGTQPSISARPSL